MIHFKNKFLCRGFIIKHLSLFLSIYLTLAPGFAFALPSDPTIRNGSVSFNQVDSKTLNVIQSTDKSIIDWRSFNIQANEKTHFQMPSANSINLSRVTGGVSSDIFGTLTSNGKLMLINPNGILFGKDSRVDVNGLVATTSDIRNQDFISGNYHFSIPPEINRTIVNRGSINIKQSGLLAFVAPGVENSGIINAKLGQISLASGKTFTLDLYGDKLVSLGIDSKILNQVIGPDGTPVSSLVANGGSIHADGGNVFLGVKAARNVVDQVINMDGLIEAQTAFEKDGKIVLLGGDEGLVNVISSLASIPPEAVPDVYFESFPSLQAVATLGLYALLFLTGLESELEELVAVGAQAFTVAMAGVILPFAFGTLGYQEKGSREGSEAKGKKRGQKGKKRKRNRKIQ